MRIAQNEAHLRSAGRSLPPLESPSRLVKLANKRRVPRGREAELSQFPQNLSHDAAVAHDDGGLLGPHELELRGAIAAANLPVRLFPDGILERLGAQLQTNHIAARLTPCSTATTRPA